MNKKFTKLMAAIALLTFLAVPMGMWGQASVTLTQSNLGLTGSYTTNTEKTIDGITYVYTDLMKSSDNIQAKASTGTIKNSTAYSGDIISVAITHSGTARPTTINGSANGTDWVEVATGSGSITADFSGKGCKYFQITRGSNAAYWTQIVITYSGTPTYTLTSAVTPTGTGTVALSETSLEEGETATATATANAHYTFTSWSITGGGATISSTTANPTTVTMGTANATITATFTENPKYNITYNANYEGSTDEPVVVSDYAGETMTIAPYNTFSRTGYAITSWNTQSDGNGTTYNAGDSYTMTSAGLTLYAQWEESFETVDVLNLAFTGISGGSGYGNWSDKEGISGAVYAGNSGGGNSSIQLRSSYNNSGIVSTTSGGKVTKVEVTWNSSTSSGRKLDIYGKNSAYTAATDLYGNNAGTLIGSITCGNNNPTVLTISSDYEYIGMRSNSNAMYLDEIKITWKIADPSAPSITAEDVEIACDATSGSIMGEIVNYVEGTVSATTDADWISNFTYDQADEVFEVNFDATVNLSTAARTANVTLTFTYGNNETITKYVTVSQTGNPNAPGTQNNPYTVAQARAAIDAGTGTQGVYATGIVSSIETAWNTQYSNITFNFVDNAGDTDFLQAYRCVSGTGVDASTVAVGDIVVVHGNLTKYGSTYEFGQGCELVSLIHPAVPSIAVSPESVELDAEEGEGAMDITYENLTITAASDFDIQYYNEQGVEISEPDWILAKVNEKVLSKDDATYEVTYTIEANNGPARTAYFKVCAMDDETNLVYSNLVTISQAAAPQQYMLTVEPFENLELITFVNDEMVMEGDGEIQVTEGNQIMLSIVALEGYVMETLMVNGVNHVNDIAADYTYSFDMPAENVIISATAVEYVPPTGDEYALYTGELVEGDYLIVYDGGAMNTTVESDRLQYEDVTVNNDVIVTDNAAIVWHIAPSGQYWTIYNADANAYAASTGAKNKAQMLADGTDDKALWTVSGTETYEFVNKKNTANNVNANLRKNGTYGFACYATSTGGALSLYKKVEPAYTLTINAHTTNGGWYLIASPVAVNPANVEGMTIENSEAPNYSNFDLYYFDQTGGQNGKEWKNYKANHFDLELGKGYLYANANTVDLTFTGVMNGDFEDVDLPYDADDDIKSLYLAGNSKTMAENFYVYDGNSAKKTVNFLTINETGDGFITTSSNEFEAAALQGFFVQSAGEGWTLSTVDRDAKSGTPELLNVMVSQNRGALVDNAIVSFGNAPLMSKFYLSDNSTRVFIQQNGEEMAVVRTEAQGEMPVNFKAAENGTYTLTVNPEGVEMNYLHLIDNMTGADIDLLAATSTGSVATYTFNASTTDYSSRFRLVFAANNEDGVSTGSTAFAFYSNGTWVINNIGEATLQVVDVNGRILSSETVNGSVSKAINASAGVYMLRLINGNDVKTQKIVVR